MLDRVYGATAPNRTLSLTGYHLLSRAGENSLANLLELKNKAAFNERFMKKTLARFIAASEINANDLSEDQEGSIERFSHLLSSDENACAFEMTAVFLRQFPHTEFQCNEKSSKLEFVLRFIDVFVERLSEKDTDCGKVFKKGLSKKTRMHYDAKRNCKMQA